MTWDELADEINKMKANVRKQEVRLVSDLDGPKQQVEAVKLSSAKTDIWHGISIGSDLTFASGHPFLELKRRGEDLQDAGSILLDSHDWRCTPVAQQVSNSEQRRKLDKPMGLTVHYNFKSSSRRIPAARTIVEQLRQKALDLQVQSVSEVVEFLGADCDFERQPKEHPHRWLLIQAGGYVQRGNQHIPVPAKAVIAFTVMLGEGSEPANIGLCHYPGTVEFEGKQVRTRLGGWRWSSFCKTQYASSPDCGGIENFLHCHLSLVALLDRAKELGVLGDVKDEGKFYDKRDVLALVQEVGEWNQMIAGAVGRLKDSFGGTIEAEITKFSNFSIWKRKVGRERGLPEKVGGVVATGVTFFLIYELI